MALQLQGNSGTIAEVLANTRALVTTMRAQDVGALGAYRMGLSSGTMAAALSSASPIVSFRYGGSGVALLRRLRMSMGVLGTGFTAGQITFNFFAARAFSASDSGGNAATLTGNNGKMRTTQASTGIADFRVSSTAALTPGTRTLDGTPFAAISFPVGTGASQSLINAQTLAFGDGPEEWPLVLAPNEGFVVQATVPATGTWCFSLDAKWEEVASF